jgi:gas vesicle protein
LRLSLPAVLILALSSLVIASCGGKSDEEQAKDDACTAVADIGTQVKQLQGYELATVTADKVKGNVNAVKSDLAQIKNALPDLSSDLKSQLQDATNAFTAKISQLVSSVGQSTSLQQAASQFTTAQKQLQQSYQSAFASVSC